MKVIRICHRLFGLEGIMTMFNNTNFKVKMICKNLKGDTFDSDFEAYRIVEMKI